MTEPYCWVRYMIAGAMTVSQGRHETYILSHRLGGWGN